MRRVLTGFTLLGVGLCGGCDGLGGIFGPSRVFVTLSNDSATYSVEATVTYDDEDDLPREVLIEVGQQREYTIAAGQSVQFSMDCDELRAIVLEDADLLVIGGLGPQAESSVLRDGDDFDCGDEIIFRFTHGPLLLDFDEEVTVR